MRCANILTVTVVIAADINRLQFPKSKMEGRQIWSKFLLRHCWHEMQWDSTVCL